MELNGKTFIVTGGGSGLGEATAKTFAEAGANVVVADMKADTGQAVADAIGAQAVFAECNVTDEAHVQSAIDLAVERFGGLNGAVNCAGVGFPGKVLSKSGPHPLDTFKLVIEINLIGTFNVIRLCANTMTKLEAGDQEDRGVFINTASVAAYEGQIGQASYSASKGGVVSMTLPIARELARFGIRVVTIVPGLFDTPMLAMLPEEIRQSLAAQVPFPKRLGQSSEFGALAKHIVENTMINGEAIRLDGAIRMQPK